MSHIRNFQPPISGDDIQYIFNISPGREIGVLKNTIKEAILDGEINNEFEPAYMLLLTKAAEMGLEKVNDLNTSRDQYEPKEEDDH